MFTKLFQEMTKRNKILIILGAILVLILVFYPRSNPVISAGMSARLGNIGGKVQLEAMENFHNQKVLILFYAPWCGHCKKLMPEWNKIEESNDTDIKIVKINGDENKELAQNYEVQGFPTIYYLPKGLNNPKDRIEYQGDRTGEALLTFIKNQ